MKGLAGVLAVATLCLVAPSVASPSPIPPSPQVWVIDADGTDPVRLTTDGVPVAWSPDGTRLAYRGSSTGLNVVNLVTGEETRVSRTGEYPSTVRWSPTGASIAYSTYEGGVYRIRAVAPDGSNWRTLFETDSILGGLDWSPDGTKIAFALVPRDGSPIRVHVLDVTTGTATPIDTTTASGGEVDWSPDGTWIAYSESSGPTSEPFTAIRVVRPDGSDDRRLSEGLQYAASIDWAPDSEQVAFYGFVQSGAAPAPDSGIFFSSPDEPSPRLAIPQGFDASWSPDGSRIAYSTGGDLFTRDRDGNDPRQLTNEELRSDAAPLWSPDGSRIAFAGTPVYVFCGGGPYPDTANVIGTNGDDVIEGTEGNDVIAGRGGNDEISGLGGNDVICGGDGDDVIVGGEGHDSLFDEAGTDQLDGSAGDDLLVGGPGDDAMAGGVGLDTFSQQNARRGVTIDLAEGVARGFGTDSLLGFENGVGSPYEDRLFGDDGPNALDGAARWWANLDDDLLVGRGGPDVLQGGSGDDRARGGAGKDSLFGGPGDDVLVGGSGEDACRGGSGHDDQRQC